MNDLIGHICALARPANQKRYRAYLRSLPEPALKQRLTDLILEEHKACQQPVKFWRVAPIRSGQAIETADRRELITI